MMTQINLRSIISIFFSGNFVASNLKNAFLCFCPIRKKKNTEKKKISRHTAKYEEVEMRNNVNFLKISKKSVFI